MGRSAVLRTKAWINSLSPANREHVGNLDIDAQLPENAYTASMTEESALSRGTSYRPTT